MEDEPNMKMEYPDGREVLSTRDNTSIFRFMGALALYDHIFVVTDPEKNQGTYIFRSHPSYEQMADYMMDNDFVAHINLRSVAECDVEAFDKMVARDVAEVEEGVPEGWE